MIARGFAKEDIMAAKFAIKKKPGGQYDFVLKAANGEIIETSENYTMKNGSRQVRRTRPARRPTTRRAINGPASEGARRSRLSRSLSPDRGVCPPL